MNGGFDAAAAAAPDDEQPHYQQHDAPDNDKNECGEEVSTVKEEHVPATLNPYDENSDTRKGDTHEADPPPPVPYDESAADHGDGEDDTFLSPLDSVLRQNANSTVRWTMTAAAFLFGLAGVLTIVVASQFRFFLVCVWAILLFLFVMFVWFVQQTVICSSSRRRRNAGDRRVFHPAVHAVAGWVQQQVQDFRDDVRDYYEGLQLLSNEAAFDSYKEAPEFAQSGASPPVTAEKKASRSALFRVVFKPVLNVAFRGRRKKRRRRREQQEAAAGAAASGAAATSYVPPRSSSYNHPKETELV